MNKYTAELAIRRGKITNPAAVNEMIAKQVLARMISEMTLDELYDWFDFKIEEDRPEVVEFKMGKRPEEEPKEQIIDRVLMTVFKRESARIKPDNDAIVNATLNMT